MRSEDHSSATFALPPEETRPPGRTALAEAAVAVLLLAVLAVPGLALGLGTGNWWLAALGFVAGAGLDVMLLLLAAVQGAG